MLKKLVKNNFFILIILILILYIAPAIYRPAQALEKAIATAIGVDLKDDLIELTMLIVIPTSDKTQSANGVDVVSAQGKSVGDAINNISLNIGKSVGLAHCDAIIVSDSVLALDLRATLDYLNRSGELTKNAILFNTSDDVKELLQSVVSSKTVPALKLSTMVEYNKEFSIAKESSLDGFYASYYTPSSVCFLPIINTKQSEQAQSEGESQSQSESSQKSDKKLECKGDLCVLQNGVKTATLSGNFSTSFNALKPDIKKGILYVQNFTDFDIKNANIMLEIRSKKVRKKAFFDGKTPCVNYSGKLIVKVVEINSKNSDLNTLSEVDVKVSNDLKHRLIDDIKKSFDEVLAQAIENNVDIFEYDNLFSATNSSKWTTFKRSYAQPANYMQNIRVNIDVKIEGKF